MVETQNGEWWMVCLAMRPYDGYYYNLGRETFLVPAIWEDGWPVVAPGNGKVQFEGPGPDLPEHKFQLRQACDHFEQTSLDYTWNFLRTPRDKFWSLTERPGFLRLHLRPETLMEKANPSFIGRRQQYINFVAVTVMEFSPKSPNESAGLVLLQRDTHQIRCVVTLDDMGTTIVKLVRREDGLDEILSQSEVQGKRIQFKVEAFGQAYRFYITDQPGDWRSLGNPVDGRLLSTPVAGGFTGAYLGMYASSNGTPSINYADFDWFEVTPIKEFNITG
jgi:alpha-N-arabinofuranosidase